MGDGGDDGEGGARMNAERPILFKGEMIRAILEGRKTMTRRVIKPQPKLIEPSGRWYWEKALDVHGSPLVDASRRWWEYYGTSPLGSCGDRLWVKEAWATQHNLDWIRPGDIEPEKARVHFLATEDMGGLMKRSPLFMPRWVSRITLEIMGVRVERVQDITEGDAKAEGITIGLAKWGFHELWDSINAKRGFGWESNCWVWVISFRRLIKKGGRG
jgi:hypothetical protein